jgi:putative ABC transport system substrate-binding protein
LDRRTFLQTVLGGLLAAPLAAEAQQAGNVPRIGWLSDGVRAGLRSHLHDAFVRGLRDLGYIEGQTVLFERRDAAQNMDRLDPLAAELVGRKVDVIVATSGAAALAAKRTTTSIPIVMTESGDPVAIGVVASLARLAAMSRECR